MKNFILFSGFLFVVHEPINATKTNASWPIVTNIEVSENVYNLSIEGYGVFDVGGDKTESPDIVWKCSDGYVLISRGSRATALYVVNKLHAQPWKLIAEQITIKSKIGAVFFEPIDTSMYAASNFPYFEHAELISETFASICNRSKSSSLKHRSQFNVELTMNYLNKRNGNQDPKFGNRILDQLGSILTPWPDDGKLFLAFGHSKNENPFVVACNATACRKTVVYVGEWAYPKRFTYVEDLITIETDSAGVKRFFSGVVNDDLSVTMQK